MLNKVNINRFINLKLVGGVVDKTVLHYSLVAEVLLDIETLFNYVECEEQATRLGVSEQRLFYLSLKLSQHAN